RICCSIVFTTACPVIPAKAGIQKSVVIPAYAGIQSLSLLVRSSVGLEPCAPVPATRRSLPRQCSAGSSDWAPAFAATTVPPFVIPAEAGTQESVVIPAQAGIQSLSLLIRSPVVLAYCAPASATRRSAATESSAGSSDWVQAFAGTTALP